MIIRKNSNRQITKNFKERELYSRSLDAPDEHYLSDNAVRAVQIIRDFFGVPVIINSTYRTKRHNASIVGASRSQHLYGNAIDFTFEDKKYLDLYYAQIVNKWELYDLLKMAGVRGFGMYDNFMHIDTRLAPAFWDNSSKKKA